MEGQANKNAGYDRYHIDTQLAPEIEKWPNRFDVIVGKFGLAKLLVSEILTHGLKDREVLTSRPCIYGVFSGPVGGFAPRPEHCVGCLRCTTEYPEFVTVSRNPDRNKLGDSYFTSNFVDAISYEAECGLIPVKGAGYRGKFGGEGWDSMWTDMSEIVRPTRDGIHGREFISTSVDIGYKPNFLVFDPAGQPVGQVPQVVSIPVPVIFDAVPPSVASQTTWQIMAKAGQSLGIMATIPLGAVLEHDLESDHTIPLVKPDEFTALDMLEYTPQLIEMHGWHPDLFKRLSGMFPECLITVRTPFPPPNRLVELAQEGVHVFHLTADYHGRGRDGLFVLDLIREAHAELVTAGIREEVTLIGSGGMIAAEHIPKALLCGLDVVALDSAPLVALQGKFHGECLDYESSQFSLPKDLTVEWGVQRLMNLVASWRDQLLEISGAMGLREIRRMRGEMGRAMFLADLEAEAFAGIGGYELAQND